MQSNKTGFPLFVLAGKRQLTMIGPWLGVGACWNKSSDSSSVVSKFAGGGGGLGGPPEVARPSEGNGGLGGALGSEKSRKINVLFYKNLFMLIFETALI